MTTVHLMNGHHHLLNGNMNAMNGHLAMNGYANHAQMEPPKPAELVEVEPFDEDNATNLIINYLPQVFFLLFHFPLVFLSMFRFFYKVDLNTQYPVFRGNIFKFFNE